MVSHLSSLMALESGTSLTYCHINNSTNNRNTVSRLEKNMWFDKKKKTRVESFLKMICVVSALVRGKHGYETSKQ